MRLQSIKALLEVDLLQTNRASGNNTKTKKIDKKNIYRRVFFQNIVTVFLFVFLFGSVVFNLPLVDFPGVFTETIGFMVLFSILQIIQLVNSLFYDDVNLSAYLSLPFSLEELFTSRIGTVFLTSFAYFIAPLVLITLLGNQTGHSFLVTIPIGLISMLVIMVGSILAVLLVLHLLHQWPLFKKNKKFLMLALYLVFFGLLFYSLYTNEPAAAIPGIGVVDSTINPLFIGFYEMFIPSMRLAGVLKVGLWIAITALFIFIVSKWVIPQLYFDEGQAVQKKKKHKKTSKTAHLSSRSKWQVFIKYQLGQLSDTTLILQVLFSKYYLTFVMIAPSLFSGGGLDFSILTSVPHLWGSYLLVGFVLGYVMITETSVSGVIISFDKENFYYIQSLPVPFRGYLKLKFLFAFLLEWLLGALAVVAVGVYLKVPILILGVFMIGFTVATYLTSLYYFMRDYRLLDLSWNNFTELMQRGVSQVMRIFIQIVILFAGLLLTFAFVFWFIFFLSETLRLVVSVIILIAIISAFIAFNKYAEQKFWSQFNA